MAALMLRRVLLGLPGLALVLAVGCSDNGKIMTPSPVYPSHQTEPTWAGDTIAAYVDEGVICTRPSGAYSIDTTLAGVWAKSLATGVAHKVAPFGSRNPDLSPSGAMLAYTQNSLITTLNLSTSSTAAPYPGSYPQWSPSGDSLAFDAGDGSVPDTVSVWVMSADGSGAHRVSESGSGNVRMADWWPDGASLVHVRDSGANGTSEIYRMNRDGTNVTRLTNNDAMETFPHVSHGGTKIAYQRVDAGGLPQIWIMNADGTGQVQVTTTGGSRPQWSLDDSKLLFCRENFQTAAVTYGVIAIRNIAAATDTLVTAPHPQNCP